MNLKDTLLKARPLFGKEGKLADEIETLLPPFDAREVKMLRKQLHITFYEQTLGVSLIDEKPFPLVRAAHAGHAKDIQDYNTKIRRNVKERYFKQFAPNAFAAIADLIGQDLPGHQNIKESIALHVFSTEPFHLLLLADQGAHPHCLLRDAANIAPISSTAIGSPGASHALVGEYKGDTFIKGIIPRGDGGLVCLGDIQLFREDARATILTAMDKGIIPYNKQGKHAKINARINVLATAAPRGDAFIGDDFRGLKKQIPFDHSFLFAFHLTFILRKTGNDAFAPAKAKKTGNTAFLKPEDVEFLKEYIAYASRIDVKFPSALQEDVIDFLKMLKKTEQKHLVELSPKTAQGLIVLAKASARMELRNIVSDIDLLRVKNIVQQSLEWGS